MNTLFATLLSFPFREVMLSKNICTSFTSPAFIEKDPLTTTPLANAL
jgi:hypothetical protein